MKPQDIHAYITQEESNFELPIPINDSWDWSMKEHIKTTVLYKNSQLLSGKDDMKPVKNITRPLLNLQHRAEGFDVKDIEIYVDSYKNYYKSFLVKKFHERWALENDLDTFIDDMVETYIDFGGVLVKNINEVKPEVVPWQSIAFCDQTDILSGTICIKHYYSPDQLKDMEKYGWGNEANGANISIDDLIVLADNYKKQDDDTRKADTPGKYVEIYETHGNMPVSFLRDTDSNDYVNQVQITAFYTDSNGTKNGVVLFKAEEKKPIFKFLARDKIFGRALGFGGAEELFEPQVWVNYSMIVQKDMLDSASKTIIQTDDSSLSAKHPSGLKKLKNLELVTVSEGKRVGQIDTFPRNFQLFDKAAEQWEAHAQQMASANDSILGVQPTSGTPFKLQELVTQESHSLHEYRKGKLATFLGEIYRDWIIPYLSRTLIKGKEFVSELTFDEMQFVSYQIADNFANRQVVEQILNGEVIDKESIDAYKQKIKDEFMKSGNKKFIEILDGEMKGDNLGVMVNIAGKQKDLAGRVDKLTNIFRTILSAPQILQTPGMAKLFNEILEASGLSPVDFSSMTVKQELPERPIQPNNKMPEMAITQ